MQPSHSAQHIQGLIDQPVGLWPAVPVFKNEDVRHLCVALKDFNPPLKNLPGAFLIHWWWW